MLIVEVKVRKRLHKKYRTHFMPLQAGEIWPKVPVNKGDRVTIIADENNSDIIYIGQEKV